MGAGNLSAGLEDSSKPLCGEVIPGGGGWGWGIMGSCQCPPTHTHQAAGPGQWDVAPPLGLWDQTCRYELFLGLPTSLAWSDNMKPQPHSVEKENLILPLQEAGECKGN